MDEVLNDVKVRTIPTSLNRLVPGFWMIPTPMI